MNIGRLERFFLRNRLLFTRLFVIPILVLAQPDRGSLLLGLPFVLLGLLLRTWAAGTIHKGGPQPTVGGPYALCRHPLYLGTFLQGLGWCLAGNSLPLLLLFLVFFVVVYGLVMRAEEKLLVEQYAEQYLWYRRRTPMFLPNPFRRLEPARFSWEQFRRNRELGNYWANFGLLLWYLFRWWTEGFPV